MTEQVMFTRWDRRRGEWVDRPSIMAREARIIMERAKGKGLSGVSRINKTATRQIVFDILWSGVEGIPDEDAIDNLVARNIKREFGR